MHRSPLCMLVLGAALAACSTRDDPRSGELLSQDSTLVARLDVDRDARPTQLPDACRTIASSTTPAIVNKPQADTLARKAYDAEILGDVQEARTLLVRAAQLDGTNKTTAYHLGRTNEALGDRSAAISAYCRYLALGPTPTESAEARQRVVSLSQVETKTATQSAANSARDSVTHAASARATKVRIVQPRPASAARVATRTSASRSRLEQRASTRGATREASSAEVRVAPNATAGASSNGSAGTSTTTVEQVGGAVERTSAGGEVVASSTPESTVDQPSRDSRASSRGPSRTQSAGIGAAAGAVIGAATGRGVKGAVIGAAAGGILGTVMGGMH